MSRPCAQYRDSGTSWVGSIPEHWETKRLSLSVDRADLKIDPEDTPERVDAPPYIGLEHVESWTGGLLPLDDSQIPHGMSNVFCSGDVLFGKLRPYLAKALCADFGGWCTTEFLVLNPRDYEQRFLLYLMLADGFISLVDSSTYGAKMPRANWAFIRNIRLPLPPLAEQRAIAAFLDRKTAEIDALIARKRLLIERLAEYRTALVTHTVTRGLPLEEARAAGLDPDPPLMDSGVEWLGDVPGHWEVKRLSLTVDRSDVKVSPEEMPEHMSEWPYVGLEHVESWTGGLLPWDDGQSPEAAANVFSPADVMIGKLRPYLAKAFRADFDGLCSTEFLVLRPCSYDGGFLLYLMLAHGFVSLVDSSTYGAKMPRANWAFIRNIRLPFPPLAEQRAIAAFLDRKTVETDALCTRVVAAIERLQEYRTALVTAAVTGKIDVRNEALHEAEMEGSSA